tara:strand:- start:4519 stop:5367 length:849 start_codon:yes stop_codon:yes gene_type:complete
MAIELNDKMVDVANKNLYGKFYNHHKYPKLVSKIINSLLVFQLKSKIYLSNIIRKFLCFLIFSKQDLTSDIKIKTCMSKNSNEIQKEILDKGYIFLENFLNNDYHLLLKKEFPKEIFLQKSKSPLKNYDMGFVYLKNRHNPNFKFSEILGKLYQFIISKDFETEINNTFNLQEKKLKCKNIVTSLANENSFLIPHKDSISLTKKNLNINFIYFVDGNDSEIEYSGGTSIFKDNGAEQVLLTPKTLKNSILMYDNTKNFYHGFKIMKKDCFRKAVTFQFNLEE